MLLSAMIPSEVGLSIDHGAVPICSRRQILSQKQFCNLIDAAAVCAAEVYSFNPPMSPGTVSPLIKSQN